MVANSPSRKTRPAGPRTGRLLSSSSTCGWSRTTHLALRACQAARRLTPERCAPRRASSRCAAGETSSCRSSRASYETETPSSVPPWTEMPETPGHGTEPRIHIFVRQLLERPGRVRAGHGEQQQRLLLEILRHVVRDRGRTRAGRKLGAENLQPLQDSEPRKLYVSFRLELHGQRGAFDPCDWLDVRRTPRTP